MNLSIRYFVFVLMLCVSSPWCIIHAEEVDSLVISYDGVGATTNCKLMYPGHFQVEVAAGAQRFKDDSERWQTQYLLSAILIRYGVNSHVEAQLEVDHSLSVTSDDGPQYGVSLLALGTKIKLNQGGNGWPEASLHGQIHLPGSSSSTFLPRKAEGILHLLLHNDVSAWYDLDYLLGSDWKNGEAGLFLGLCNNFPINERWTLMLQSQNLLCDGVWDNNLQFETSYMLRNRLMLDLSSNWNLNNLGKNWDLMATVAWLF